MPSPVAIAIPCLNEAPNLEILLPRIRDVIEQWRIPAEVYVIDGGSTDGTPDTARRLGATVIVQRGKGYGGATRTAFEDIDAEYVITLDADFSHHPAFIKYLYDMRDQAEIVIASRYVEQGYGAMPWSRTLLSGALNQVFRRVLSIPVHDLSSGYRLYRRRAIVNLDLEYDTYAILQEILVKAFCRGYRVTEIPFHYLPRRHGTTHARLFSFAVAYLSALRSLWRLRNSIESADYDTRAFYSIIPLQRWWQRKRYRILLEYIGDAMRVLDTGCGSTQLLNGVPQMIGMDIQHKKLRFMRRPGRSLVNGSTLDLPFRDEAFDVVVSSQVIEHIPRDDGVLRELSRCLRPGGVLVIGTPDYAGWWPFIERLYALAKPTGYAEEHITHYTRETLTAALEGAGFRVEAYDYILNGELIMKARKPERQ